MFWACRHKRDSAVGLTRCNLSAKRQQKGFSLASLTRKSKGSMSKNVYSLFNHFFHGNQIAITDKSPTASTINSQFNADRLSSTDIPEEVDAQSIKKEERYKVSIITTRVIIIRIAFFISLRFYFF